MRESASLQGIENNEIRFWGDIPARKPEIIALGLAYELYLAGLSDADLDLVRERAGVILPALRAGVERPHAVPDHLSQYLPLATVRETPDGPIKLWSIDRKRENWLKQARNLVNQEWRRRREQP